MKIFYDTEFIDDGRTIDLISIGMVREDGAELYAVNRHMPVRRIRQHKWLMENVWPSLPTVEPASGERGFSRIDLAHPNVRPRAQIARLVEDFIRAAGPDPQLWAYYSAYDHVALAQLWGPMINLPAGIPRQSDDIVTAAKLAGLAPCDLPRQADGHHNALADARHNRVMAEYIDTVTGRD